MFSDFSFDNRKKLTNLMYIPALILFAIFTFYPLVSGVNLSFLNWNGYEATKTFAGIENYKSIIDDKYFVVVLKNTLIFGFGCTIIQQILGLVSAIILQERTVVNNISRTLIYMPVLVSPVIMGAIYYMILQYNGGPFNDIVLMLGGEKVAWLSDKNLAVLWIVIVNSIQFMGLSMILYLAGLQNISGMYYEAAKIDGASSTTIFRRITLPLLYPAIVSSVTINLIGGLKLFDVIKVLTNGGPGYSTNSISTYISLQYFNSEKAGYASAIGVILFVLILIISLLLNFGFNKWGEKLNG